MAVDFEVLARIFLSKECYKVLVIDLDIFNISCLLLVLSKTIGFAVIILTSLFLQLPQVLKILKSRSAEGVSLFSQTLILMAHSSSLIYSVVKDFPLSTWGESIALAIQTLAVCNLILIYDNRTKAPVIFTVIYVILVLIFFSPFIPMRLITMLEMAAIPLSLGAKAVQIYQNFRYSGTGQLSSITLLLQCFRTFGRLFTNLIETQDLIRMVTFSSNGVLNCILVYQFFYYKFRNTFTKRKREASKQKKG